MRKDESKVILLKKSINQCLEETLGQSGANAIRFYVDTNIAASNIHEYARILRKVLGPGAAALEKACAMKLYHNLGLEFRERDGYTLDQYVEDLGIS
jgi:hypothetical protein